MAIAFRSLFRFLTLAWLLLAGFGEASAQSELIDDSTSAEVARKDPLRKHDRGEYALVAYVGGGLSYYSSTIGVPDGSQDVRVYRFGVPFSLRLVWHPDHRLRLGLESGRTHFYTYSSTIAGKEGKVRLSAVPILLVWSMPFGKRFNLFVGSGTYLMDSKLTYAGKVKAREFSMGWMAAFSYVQPVRKNVSLAAEVKWMDATETEDANFVMQLQLVWKCLRW